MILQKLTKYADPDIVAKAMKSENPLSRQSYALVREVATDTYYLLRAPLTTKIGPVGSVVTLKADPNDYKPRADVTAEIIRTARTPHLLDKAIPSIVAMLAGVSATIAGLQLTFGSGSPPLGLWTGLCIVVAGICGVAHYVRDVAPGSTDLANGYLKTAIDHGSALRVASILRDGESAGPVALETPIDVPALPPPDHSNLVTIGAVTVPVPILAR